MENEARGPRLEIQIDLGNDAFQADQNGEIARVLKDFAREVLEGILHAGSVDLKDINGNTVGKATLVGIKKEEEIPATQDEPEEPEEELSVTKAMESDDPFINVGMIAQIITRNLTPESLEEAKKKKKLKKAKKSGKGKK